MHESRFDELENLAIRRERDETHQHVLSQQATAQQLFTIQKQDKQAQFIQDIKAQQLL